MHLEAHPGPPQSPRSHAMTYETTTGQRIVCDDYKAFLTIAKQYFGHIALNAWKRKWI